MTDKDGSKKANHLPKDKFRITGGFLWKVIFMGFYQPLNE
jgi:hypothetical protein